MRKIWIALAATVAALAGLAALKLTGAGPAAPRGAPPPVADTAPGNAGSPPGY
jgi:2-methylisocitrate lyase-like PEP mutase family enzyme